METLQIGSKTELVTTTTILSANVMGAIWEWATKYDAFPIAAEVITFILTTVYLYWVIRGRRAKVRKDELEFENMQKDKQDKSDDQEQKV